MELSHLYWHFGNLSVYKALNIPTYEAFTKCTEGGGKQALDTVI